MNSKLVKYDANQAYAAQEVAAYERAFQNFNDTLFGGELPMPFITLQRKRGLTLGYFWNDQFKQRNGDQGAHELALNPETFEGRTEEDICSTLVHEMCHLWQQEFGKPSRNGYHNKQWGMKMREVGLIPSNTGEPGGKDTGQQMDHYIDPDGPFVASFRMLKRTGWGITWQAKQPQPTEKSTRKNKVKYSCDCGNNVWGKPDLNIVCGDCGDPFEDQS